MDDFDGVVDFDHSVENLEAKPAYDLPTDTWNGRGFGRFRVPADELNRRINRGENAYRTSWTEFGRVLMN
jgi:hypothetical protein